MSRTDHVLIQLTAIISFYLKYVYTESINGDLNQELITPIYVSQPLVRKIRDVSVVSLSNISHSCNSTEFKCLSGKCIPAGLQCDGHAHCDDASDEEEHHCFTVFCDSISRFKCRSGECITKSWRCDSDYDCFDKSDEDGCDKYREEKTCDPVYFTCGDGACVSKKWRCDGDPDCADGSDEQNCLVSEAATCTSHMFQCKDLQCVPYSFICDGDIDCKDGSDEDCDNTMDECRGDAGYFECSSGGKCITAAQVCDSHPDCSGKTDEGGRCNEKCHTDSCPGGCFMTPTGPQCTCDEGYEFDSDLKQCQDMDECLDTVGVCDQECKNNPGGYNCSCFTSYTLQSDGSTCRTDVNGRTMLLFSAGHGVRVYYLDGFEYLSVHTGYKQTYGVAYDPVDEMVYWSTEEGVFKKTLKEAAIPAEVVTQGVGLAENLAIDWLGRNLYIIDSEKNHILVCTMDGKSCKPIVNNIAHPRAIQLDLEGRRMYWSCVNQSIIESSSMDGSDRKTLIKDGIVWPNALALDVPAKRLYWFDASSDQAEHSRLDGSDRKVLPQAVADHPYSMAVWEDKVYWTDWTQDEIMSALKLTGKNQEPILKESMQQLFGLTIYHPALFQNAQNPCDSKLCSHICLLSSEEYYGYTCMCPIPMELASNRHSCKELPRRDYPFIGDGTRMYRVDLTVYGHTSLSPWHPDLSLQRISDMEYDPKNNLVLVSDTWAGTIISISLDTGIKQTLIANVKPVGVSVDWVRDNVYWVDGLKHGVEVIRSDGNYRSLLLNGLHSPTDIAVSPLDGSFFVSDVGLVPYIMRCGLDGKDCIKIVTTNLEHPFALVFDHDPQIKRLYWSDARLGRIEAVAVDGSARQVIRSNIEEPLSLSLHSQDILWSQRGSTNLHWVTKLESTTSSIGTLDLGLPTTDSSSNRVLILGEMGWQIPSGVQANTCAWGNGHCQHLCLADVKQVKVCGCGLGFQLGDDGASCKAESCYSHQFQCTHNGTCIPASWRCDGTRDCSDGTDEEDCQVAKSCTDNDFQCSSGNCISASWRCDGHHDCDDGSDEESCPPIQCSSHQWRCDSGQCIPSTWLCDGQPECQDASDEKNCTTSCSQHQFTCTDGRCIPDSWSCDGDPDCLDGSDESECDECVRGLFRCGGGSCIGRHLTCDGRNDCEDGSDEDTGICQMLISSVCSQHQLDCGVHGLDGIKICVPREARCNSTSECPGGEDENDCDHCRRNEFTCHSDGHCVPMMWLCDGDGDCEDGSDEFNCVVDLSQETEYSIDTSSSSTVIEVVTLSEGTEEKTSESVLGSFATILFGETTVSNAPTCAVGQFICSRGENKCLNQELVCDGNVDCLDGSDEHGNCEISCGSNNGGCQQVCSPSPNKPICSCHTGYVLDSDEASCSDLDECSDETTCSHSCENIHGSYICSCLPDYVLLPDKSTCKFKDGEEWTLAISPNMLLNISHNHLETDRERLNVNHYISSLEYDPVTKNVFYAHHHGSIRSSSLEFNKDEEKVYFKDLKYPSGVSLDYVTRNMYFSEYFESSSGIQRSKRDMLAVDHPEVTKFSVIKMCNIDTSRCSFVYHGFNVKVPDTAVSTKFNYLFFCTNNLNKQEAQIIRSNLDGDRTLILAYHKVVECGNLALDEVKQRVYWSDTALNTIESVDWNGHRRRKVQKEMVNAPLGLAVQSNWIIWVNADQQLLMRCDKYNASKCTTLPLDDKPQGIIPVKPQYLSKENVCAIKESCQQMCAPRPDGSPECRCQLGYAPSEENAGMCLLMDGCLENPCQGGGTCEPHANGIIICRCPENRLGRYCEIGVEKTQSADSSILTLVIILIVLLFIGCALAYYKRECILEIWSRKMDKKSKLNFHFVNPVFGVVRDERIFVPSPVTPLATSAPLKQGCNHFENPSFKEHYAEGDSLDSALGKDLSTSISISTHDIDLSSPIPPPLSTSTLEWKQRLISQ